MATSFKLAEIARRRLELAKKETKETKESGIPDDDVPTAPPIDDDVPVPPPIDSSPSPFLSFSYNPKPQPTPQPVVEKPKGINFIPLVKNLFSTDTYSDITFVVGEEKKTFQAHKVILAICSPTFGSLLFPDGEKEKPIQRVEFPDISASNFAVLLRSIYCSSDFKLSEDEVKEVAELLKIADAFDLKVMKESLVRSLATGLTASTCLGVYSRVSSMDKELQTPILKFIGRNTKAVLDSKEFLELKENEVVNIISSNELTLKEVEIFKAVVNWGYAECKRRKLDLSPPKGTQNLQDVLTRVVSEVRFSLMSFLELSQSVSPTGAVKPSDLVLVFTLLSIKKVPDGYPFKRNERIPNTSDSDDIPIAPPMISSPSPPMGLGGRAGLLHQIQSGGGLRLRPATTTYSSGFRW